jgi:CheY-like chemotaxis protein
MTIPHPRVGRILVVDNDADRLDSTYALLNSRGYQVFIASTLSEAAEFLVQQRVHVALLDIRMEADSDPTDTSGLGFAALVDPVVVKIIITGYPSYEAAKEALGPITGMPAVDFITKQEGPGPLLAALERAFQEKVKINFDLRIHWQDGLTLEQVAQEIELQDYALAVVTSEVEEVLGKLFFTADEIIVSPLISDGRSRLSSQSGAAILRVEPNYREGGWGAPVVVKLTSREKAVREADNYKRFVRDFIGGYRRTNLDWFAETHLLGGLIYSLVGTSLEETIDLGSFYVQHDSDKIITTLDHFFAKTCHLWYDNRKPRQVLNLTQSYREALKLSRAKIEAALRAEKLEEFIAPLSLQFPGLEQTFVNPLHWFEGRNDWVALVHTCVTHGDLHSRNVLIDERGQAWIIDFYRTGEGHLLRDLIELETDVKFALLGATDLPVLLKFEVALLAARRLGDTLSSPDFSTRPELEKAFAVIAYLRGIAGRLLGAETEMEEYYWGLFLLTLNALRLKSIDRLKKRHALLSAALLAQRLQAWPQSWTPSPPISLEKPRSPRPPSQPSAAPAVLSGRMILYTLLFIFGLAGVLIALVWAFSAFSLSLTHAILAVVTFFLLSVVSLIALGKLRAEEGLSAIVEVLKHMIGLGGAD